MDKTKRPTKAAIEAALSACYAEVDAAKGIPDQQRIFDEIVMNSEDLQGAIIGVAVTMDPQEHELPEDTFKKAQELLASGDLREDILQRINAVVGMFFWIGWHARGAMEAKDDLQKMME